MCRYPVWGGRHSTISCRYIGNFREKNVQSTALTSSAFSSHCHMCSRIHSCYTKYSKGLFASFPYSAKSLFTRSTLGEEDFFLTSNINVAGKADALHSKSVSVRRQNDEQVIVPLPPGTVTCKNYFLSELPPTK